MTRIKCDKILCFYNLNDNCLCDGIELVNGDCTEYKECEIIEEDAHERD